MANLITVQVDKSGRRLPFDLVVRVEDLSVPQHRVRQFLVCTRSKAPLSVQLHSRQHVPDSSFKLLAVLMTPG